MAKKTGNIAVEKFCRGKPSGINITKSDYIIYVIPDDSDNFKIVIYQTKFLRDFCNGFREVHGGDIDIRNNVARTTTVMNLIPLGLFIKNGREMADGKNFKFGLSK